MSTARTDLGETGARRRPSASGGAGGEDAGRREAARKQRVAGWTFILPTIAVLVLLNTFPLLYSLALSFSRVDTSTGLNFGGITLANWSDLMHDAQFWSSVRFTVVFTILAVIVEYAIGLSLALLLREKLWGGSFFRVLFSIPMMLAPVAIGFTWRMLYDPSYGPIDAVLRDLGLGAPGWLSSGNLAVVSVVIMDLWEWTPLLFLLMLAGLQAIPNEVVEAARVDGANGFQMVLRVILPMLAPVSVMAIFLRMIDSFQIFGQIFLLTGGGPGTATTSTTLYGFFQGFQSFDLGYGAAIALALLVLVILAATLFLWVSRRMLRRVEA